MASLPTYFLETTAEQNNLTEFQTAAFVARFSQMEATDWQIALNLNISRSLYSTRMTAVYKKFGLPGKTPGKARELFLKLFELYQEKQSPSDQVAVSVIESIAAEIRHKNKEYIQKKCGSMRVLDMDCPINIVDIYTEVQILNQVTSHRYLQISELMDDFNPELDDLSSFRTGKNNNKRISGVELVKKNPRLMLLGRPGAGKTTFLKHIAIHCQTQEILPGFIPIFVSLRDFSSNKKNDDLLSYIHKDISQSRIDSETLNISSQSRIDSEALNKLLEYSKVLFLLDGLDEVSESNIQYVTDQIRFFSEKFYGCRFIITCRIAAHEFMFDRFTEVEIADFNHNQVKAFASNWFKAKGDISKISKFIHHLETDPRIYILATNPLLLTLLCLVFGDSAGFPANRSELYEEGIYVLLKKWDARRNIERANAYEKLSRQRKEDLLSHIAYLTFDKNEYFFKRKKIEHEIEAYIRNLPSIRGRSQSLDIDCREILNSIESQHGLLTERAQGIYSFSHLTFHEYFTSRKIVNTLDPSAQTRILKELVAHITEKRWREVFLLVVGMLSNADYILQLMKDAVDKLLSENSKAQDFLKWVNLKATSIGFVEQRSIENAMTRDFYFTLSILRIENDAVNREIEIINRKIKKIKYRKNDKFQKNLELALDSELMIALNQANNLNQNISLSASLVSVKPGNAKIPHLDKVYQILVNILNRCINRMVDIQFKQALQDLYDELSNPDDSFQLWWQAKGESWTQKLRATILTYRDLGRDWKFTPEELNQLNQYYDANRLLMACLNSECYVSQDVRQDIQNTLLLPIASSQLALSFSIG